jgi:hypothetical protein
MAATGLPDWRLRWHVFRCRQYSDTRTRYLLELARCVARSPRAVDAPPLLEIGTRSGGSARLILRVLDDVYRGERRPLLLTVDPYGSRPYEGRPHVYDDRHYIAMKRTLAPYANHIHYMMDSDSFLRTIESGLYLWLDGAKRPIDRFTMAYLDGSHDPDIVWSEIERVWPRLVPGGYLIVDDTDWFGGEVRRRLDAAATGLGGTLRHHGKQGILQR